MQKAQSIPVKPAFLDLPVVDTVDVDGGDRHRFAGGRDAGKGALMDAGGGPAGGHFVPFGDLVGNHEVQITKGGTGVGDKLGQSGSSRRFPGDSIIAHALRTSRNAPLSANDQQIFDQLVQQTHAALGEERFTTAWHKGARLAHEQTDFAALFGVMLNATRA